MNKSTCQQGIVIATSILLSFAATSAFANRRGNAVSRRVTDHVKMMQTKNTRLLGAEGSRTISGRAEGIERSLSIRLLRTQRPIRTEEREARITFDTAERGRDRSNSPEDTSIQLDMPSDQNSELPGIRVERGLPERHFTQKIGATHRGVAYQRESNFFEETQFEETQSGQRQRRNIKKLTRYFSRDPKSGVVYERADLTRAKVEDQETGSIDSVANTVRYYKHVDGERVPISLMEHVEGMKNAPKVARRTNLYHDPHNPPLH